MIAVYILIAVVLLLLNAFFVLAEFATVKLRPSRVQELVDQGNVRATVVQYVQRHLDEYLSVCQVGITFASIGLGFVGEPAFAELILSVLKWIGAGSEAVAHAIAITMAYLLVSFLHILLGELVPKSMAIRGAERAALLTAGPLKFFRYVFIVPFVLLNASANFIVRLLGMPPRAVEEGHTEEELRIILGRSQSEGLITFRRLLLLENVFDLGGVRVRDAMKPKSSVKVLRAEASWDENFKTIRETRFSRFPLVEAGQDRPLGVVHVKDILYSGPGDLRKLVRPYVTTTEDTMLEMLMADLQRKRQHAAMVFNRDGKWTGMITLEDVIEEIIGVVEDEYEVEPPIHLGDAISVGRVVLNVQAASMEDAIRHVLKNVPAGELPKDTELITRAVCDREKLVSTYLGRGLAVPHARLEGMDESVCIFARSEQGIPLPNREEKAHLLFILLTPLQSPHLQARLLARIGGIMESEFVEERLHTARTPQEVIEAIRAGETAVLG